MIRRRRSATRNRRKSRWEGGFAFRDVAGSGLAVPTIANSSVVDVAWARVPSGAFDTINNDKVLDDCTLYRSLNTGQFTLQKTVASGHIEVILGMGVLAWDGIDDTAPVITEVPLPVQGGGGDWIWTWTRPVQLVSVGAGGQFEFVNLVGPSELFQSRAMRKLSTNVGLLLVVEVYAMISGMAALFGWTHEARYALKLP